MGLVFGLCTLGGVMLILLLVFGCCNVIVVAAENSLASCKSACIWESLMVWKGDAGVGLSRACMSAAAASLAVLLDELLAFWNGEGRI
jgi:hypothetical protein